MLAANPRPFGAACSIDISAAPAHSPPTAKPWMIRRVTSRIGAAIPIVCWVGSRPMRKLTPPIMTSVMMRMFLRPNLSPK